ncbi:MAG: N-6 DNA methylase [Luteolibacter sp.]|nr:N-6 DNA methylase [Luteolibacter sp.]
MRQTVQHIENALGLETTRASLYLSSPDDLVRHPELASVAFSVRQAWEKLRLDGVLFIDHQPAAYLKHWGRAVPADEKEPWIRFLWNQGTAPLLLLIEPTKIEVHSAMFRPPASKDSRWSDVSLVDTWTIAAEALEQNSLSDYLRKIETGQIYRDCQPKFDTENAVDRSLMRNLNEIRNQLGFHDKKIAHNLLGRLLFISFLCDRGFLTKQHFPGKAKNLKEFFSHNRGHGSKAVKLLYDNLFASLQREFNGSMFSPDMKPEQECLTPDKFDLLADFLNGDEISTGQMTLPFWVYDFRHIPVETISAIYEDFLEAEDAEGKHELGAYYTPRHLAEMVVNISIQDRKDVGSSRFLDPSCGSGVFLVIAFNLLAEHWQFHQGNGNRHKHTRINALLDILLNQIRGVDKDPTACRIAAFSLYLALFEKVEPVELEEFKASLKGKPILPNLLTPNPDNRDGFATITHADFIEDFSSLPTGFDCIVGNPPWGQRGSKQIAFPFVRDAPRKTRNGGIACFVLPTTMLVSEQGTLTQEWFGNHKVGLVVNLADYQNQLFVGPDYPCFIMRYSTGKPTKEHSIRYLTPKVCNYDNRRGLIPLEPGDEKVIHGREIAACENNVAFRLLWVSRFQASARDLKFLQRLWMMPKLGDITGEPESDEVKPFIRGVGFQPFYLAETKGGSQPLPEAWKNSPYLDSSAKLDLTVTVEDCNGQTVGSFLGKHRSQKGTKASLTLLRRKPDEQIFRGPLFIHNKGFTKFAYFGEYRKPIRFQDSLQAFSSTKNDRRMIALLAGFLQSDLAKYLIFHSAAGWIAGRNQIHLEDKLHLPFPLPDSPFAGSDAEVIADRILKEFENLAAAKKKHGAFFNPEESIQTKERLDELIYQYYGVGANERMLIEDTCRIYSPSVRPGGRKTKGPALMSPKEPEIDSYQEILCKSINQFISKFGSRRKVALESVLKPGQKSRLRLLVIRLTDDGDKKRSASGRKPDDSTDGFSKILSRMEQALRKEDTPFQYLRGFKFLEEDHVYILKPDILRHWTRSAALNDADEIISHLANLRRSKHE